MQCAIISDFYEQPPLLCLEKFPTNQMFGWLKRLLGLEKPPPGAHQPAPPLPGPPWNQYWMQPPYPNQHWMQPTYAYLPPYHPAEPFSNVYPPATVQQDLYPPAAVPHDAAYPRAPQLGWNNYPPYPWPYPPPPVPQNPAPFGHAASLLPVALPPTSPPVTTSLDSVSPQWPNGNIKIECLTDKKPDDWNDEGWAWRSSGPRVNEIPASAYKSEKHVCLGVFHCNCKANDGSPSRLYRPKKNKAARTNQFSETCHLCRGNLKQIACPATLMSYRILDDDGNEHTVRQHSYYHNHPRPPTKRLAAADIDALDQEVRKNPHLTAQQLRAGTGAGQMALGEINPVLLDSRKARHEVDKSKIRQGIAQPTTTRNAGFQLLDLARKIHESFDTPWIVKSELLNGQFIVMQTPFMRDVLLRDHLVSWGSENLDAERARHGLPTDGSHDFSKEGVLLTSIAFSPVVTRWVPVLYTWIGTLDEKHHKAHFNQLLSGLAEILDFSPAQRGGFVGAFVDFMCARIPGWDVLSNDSRKLEAVRLKKLAETLLRGCLIHWRRSLHKIRQVIGASAFFRFDGLIRVLEGERTTPDEFVEAVELIRTEFVEIRLWLAWWTAENTAALIFPAVQKMPASVRARIPDSTNSVESSHWVLYRAVGQQFDLFEGIRRLYRFQRETEMLYHAVLAGHVNARFKGSKPELISHVNWVENDGRAPDTVARLKAMDEFSARLASLTDEERWAQIEADQKLKANANTVSLRNPAPLSSTLAFLALQSYLWERNSCFIDSSNEALFRAVVAMPQAVRINLFNHIRTAAPKSGLRAVIEHYWNRGVESGEWDRLAVNRVKESKTNSKLSLKRLLQCLEIGQLNTRSLIERLGWATEYSDGMPECSRTWVNNMFQSMETGPHLDDIWLAQAIIDKEFGRPRLDAFLEHIIPRDRGITTRATVTVPIHTSPAISCSHGGCNRSAPVQSVSTHWPLQLRFVPQTLGTNNGKDSVFWKGVECKFLALPLTLSIGPGITYSLIAIVRYLGDHIHMGHYTTRIKLNNLAYEYDDTRDGGKLRELGPVEVLHFDIHVAYALYLRTSEEAISTRLATDIQVDFAKIPPSTIDDTLLSRSPSPVSPEVLGKIKANGDAKRSTEQDSELNFEMDLEKDINQLLLESITISKPSHLTRRVRFSSDSPPPEIETLLGSSESGTPAPLKCTGCRERAAETTETQSGDPEGIFVQCESCEFWSHKACLPGGVDWDADDVSFICQFCDPKLQPGASIVVFPLPPDSDISDIMCIWYPAIFVQRQADMDGEADEFEFKWSSLIDSDAADGAFSVSKSVLQAVMSATVSDSQIGCLSVPRFMNISLQPGDDFLKLLALFAMALDEVAHILVDLKTSHPVIEHYANFKAKARKAKKKSSHAHWVASLGFPVDVPELEALTIDSKLMRKLQTHSHLTENLTPGEIADRVSGPGFILLQLLYIQHQIGEPYNLNGDLFRDLNDGVVRGDNKLYYTLKRQVETVSRLLKRGIERDWSSYRR
ncbi:hypothetical protein GGX14DRAFT_626610 [Mycena pura]|uniref:GCM domain-containing protein n=1 Tax=Mycena pura TaxID=153505 RepID=A0AAD6VI27_9AGAR|nr:hypothetical protein GGX14DRAFT_626610 [Mycena pura]